MKIVGTTLTIEPREVIEGDLIPAKKEELHRDIIVSKMAEVKGSIVGGRVYLRPGCVVRGGILASQILIDVSEEPEVPPDSLIKVEGDLASLSMVTITEVDLTLLDKSPPIIYVMGNVVAPHMVRLANALIGGNVVSSRVELRNVILRGILGITKSRERREEGAISRLSNAIVPTIVSHEDVEIPDFLGVLLPVMYFSQGVRVRGEGVVKILRLGTVKKNIDELYKFIAKGWSLDKVALSKSESREMQYPLSFKAIIDGLLKDSLYELDADKLSGLIALIGVEEVPFVKKIRGEELIDSLIEVLLRA